MAEHLGMMDQLSSVGCEFVPDALERLYDRNVQYYHSLKPGRSKREKCAKCCCHCCCGMGKKEPLPWAATPIYNPNKPVRPWSLHNIQSVNSPIYDLAGKVTRLPGMYKKTNPKHGGRLRTYLEDTNERIHSSVRVRLACEGLGLNDSNLWECPALLRMWRPRRVVQKIADPVPFNASWGPKTGKASEAPIFATNEAAGGTNEVTPTPDTVVHNTRERDETDTGSLTQAENSMHQPRWVWEYIGPEVGAPFVRTLVEENMGPWERHLLQLSTGKVHVCDYADAQRVENYKAIVRETLKKSKKSRKSHKSSP